MESADPLFLILNDHLIMFFFDIAENSRNVGKLLIVIFHLILHEVFELILPIFFFLDKIIIFLPSQCLLFNLEGINPVLKHIFGQLLHDQTFIVIL